MGKRSAYFFGRCGYLLRKETLGLVCDCTCTQFRGNNVRALCGFCECVCVCVNCVCVCLGAFVCVCVGLFCLCVICVCVYVFARLPVHVCACVCHVCD